MRTGFLSKIKRVVIKVGTKLLVNEKGRLDGSRVEVIAEELKDAKLSNREVVLVTSGAIVVGLESLGLSQRPKELPFLQAAAAIGQSRLMHYYQEAFNRRDQLIAQVLLTAEDLKDRRRHINARNTFESLLSHGVIPIVNENDTVAVDEIKFGDNDQLSALVSNLIKADLLIILTDQDGFLKDGSVLSTVFEIGEHIRQAAGESRDWKGTGGMQSKLNAARIMMRSGECMVIANGRTRGIVKDILQGDEVGTLFVPKREKMSGKKRWIAHFAKANGRLVLDAGAVTAIRDKSRSLLLPGVKEVMGHFSAGDTVGVYDEQGHEVARGIVNYSEKDLHKRLGTDKNPTQKTGSLKTEVIHRDNLVLL